jgi:TetR/AcrR family transcriptional regulator
MGTQDGNTEEKILEAAKTIFMQYGLYGARMQDIADTAGINKALLHYYFRSKEKLFDAVFEGALEKYFGQMTVIADTSIPLVERVHQYIDNVFQFYVEYPQMSIFIIKEISSNPEMFKLKVEGLKGEHKSVLIPTLTEMIAKKEIEELDPVIFLINLHSLCAYPFLASPIFKVLMKKAGQTWSDDTFDRIKQSVKDFVSFKLITIK